MADEEDITLKTILDHIRGLGSRMDRLEIRMDSLEKNISSLQKDVSSLQKNVSELDKKVDAMDLKLSYHMESIDRTEIYIDRQKHRLPAKLGNHEKRIKKLEGAVFVSV